MDKVRFRRFIWRILPITIFFGVLGTAALSGGLYWFGIIMFAVTLLIVRNQYKYFARSEPEILEADEQSSKEGWKFIAIGMTVTIAAALIGQHYENGKFAETLVMWVSVLWVSVFFGYIIIRSIRLHREARKRVEERKARESEARD